MSVTDVQPSNQTQSAVFFVSVLVVIHNTIQRGIKLCQQPSTHKLHPHIFKFSPICKPKTAAKPKIAAKPTPAKEVQQTTPVIASSVGASNGSNQLLSSTTASLMNRRYQLCTRHPQHQTGTLNSTGFLLVTSANCTATFCFLRMDWVDWNNDLFCPRGGKKRERRQTSWSNNKKLVQLGKHAAMLYYQK